MSRSVKATLFCERNSFTFSQNIHPGWLYRTTFWLIGRFNLSKFSGPCAAGVSGRPVPFWQEACAVSRNNRHLSLWSPMHHPLEVSACSIPLELRQHGTGGTSEF